MATIKAQLHTAEHIFWSFLKKLYPEIQTESLEFRPEDVRLDYKNIDNIDLNKIKSIEAEVIAIIKQNIPIKFRNLNREEASKIIDLSLVPQNIDDIRIVDIGNISSEACIGEHVNNTSEIQGFSILNLEQKGKNRLRVYIGLKDETVNVIRPITNNTKPQTLKGFRDFLPDTMRVRNYVINIFKSVFESYGFEPVETPTLEYSSTLMGKYGEEADKLVYSFLDKGGRSVGLRYDLTVPISKVLAIYKDKIPLPFKRYQIQPVWRADKPQKGRYREVLMCDIDSFGQVSPTLDAEIISIIYQILTKLNFSDFSIRLNSRQILNSLLDSVGIKENKSSILQSIDKLNKIKEIGVQKELISKGLNQATISQIFQKLKVVKPDEYLSQVFDQIKFFGVPEKFYTFDPSMVRGLDYYTGPIFETYVTSPKIGSITGGGRYDNLISSLGGPDIPAVGTTLGLDRIVDCIQELNLMPELSISSTKVLVTIFDDTTISKSLQTANSLRQANINTFLYPTPDKLGKQFKFASDKKIPYVVVIGPDEIKANTVTLKDMNTGSQQTLKLEDLLALLQKS